MADKRRVGHRRGMRIEGACSVQHLALGVADSVDSGQGKPPNVPTRRSDYDRHTERIILVMPENMALCLTVGHDGIAYRPVHTEV
jgi:hypothetical protein